MAEGTRLVITHMELENFKSYSGTIKVGPFHKFFSSVVGPNGSGKSNVIDALLFVFGFKASSIRLRKLSELVHSSTKNGSASTAKVTVYFSDIINNQSEELQHIPNSQFSVTRITALDNSSKYYINDKKATFAEVSTLLRQKGIDLDHNRFLILQGEVEAIALMPPKAKNEHETGMLEYLEDIIGTTHYKEDIAQVSRNVEQLSEEREGALHLVEASKKDRDSLLGAKTEAEEYLRVECNYIKAQSLSHQVNIFQQSKKRTICEQKLSEVSNQLQKLKQEMQQLNEEATSNESAFKGYSSELAKRQKEMSQAQSALNSLQHSKLSLTENTKNEGKQLKKLQETIKKDELSLKQYRSTIVDSEKRLEVLRNEIEQIKPEYSKHESKLEEMTKQLERDMGPYRKKIDAKTKELLPFRQKLSSADDQLKLATTERDLFISQTQEVNTKLEKEIQSANDLKSEVSNLDEQLSEMKKQYEKMELEHSRKKKEYLEITQEREKVAQKFHEAYRKSEELKNQNMATKSTNVTIDFLMEMKRKGQLSGIHGRLGDLGAIDPKYDVAISTVCGQLNHVVVDDVATGQKCLDLLQQHNKGRITVIILDKQQHLSSKSNSAISTPEGVKRLFDLVKPKRDIFKTAFYWALGDTLVCDDLTQATRIAFSPDKRWRVVTLDGKVIDTSGTMSGGGKPTRGLMSGSLPKDEVDPKEIQKAEAATAKLKEQLASLTEREEETGTQVHRLQIELEKTGNEIVKIQAELQGRKNAVSDCEARIAALKKQIGRQSSEKAVLDAKLKEMEKKIQQISDNKTEIQRNMQHLEDELAELENKRDEVGGTEFKTLKYKISSLDQDLKDKQSEATKLQVTLKSTQTAITKLEKKIEDSKNEMHKSEGQNTKDTDKLQKLDKDLQSAKALAEKKKSEYQEMEGQGQEQRQRLNEIKAQRAKMSTTMADLEIKVKDLTKELNQMNASIRDLERRIQELDRELQKNIEKYGSDYLEGCVGEIPDSQVNEEEEDNTEEDPHSKKRKKSRATSSQQNKKQKVEIANTRVPQETLSSFKLDRIQRDVMFLEETMNQMKPNLQALIEWREREREYKNKVDKLEQISKNWNEKLKELETLKKKRLSEFMNGFSQITTKLKEMYQMLTLGGDADLELVDSFDPFTEGISFSVRPPRKSWKQISNLSGGEKTLSSLALVFALHHFQPSPLYVLDEIDAALDFKNVSIVANYIKEQARNAQFIIISLRNNMFELADRLVGIYKTEDCSQTVAINPASFKSSLPNE